MYLVMVGTVREEAVPFVPVFEYSVEEAVHDVSVHYELRTVHIDQWVVIQQAQRQGLLETYLVHIFELGLNTDYIDTS